MISGGWEARLVEDHHDWAAGVKRLVIFHRDPEGGGHQIVGWDESGMPIMGSVEPGARLRDGIVIPAGAVESLRDQLKPGPSERELVQLREALAFERARVDRILQLAANLGST